MSIHRHIPTQLTAQQIEVIRQRIEERERDDAILMVVDGGDLDRGRCSRLEFIAIGRIEVDAEDIDALLCEGDQADRVRRHIDDQVTALTREWLDTYRGQQWLEERVEACLAEEIEEETERMAEARADQFAMRFEKVG